MQVGDVVTGELEGGLAADMGLGILGEGGETIELLEDGEVSLGMAGRLKAVEALIVLVKAADDALDGIVGGGDVVGADAVGECGPVAFEEVEDSCGCRCGLHVVLALGEKGGAACVGQGGSVGVSGGKEFVDLLLEARGWWVILGVAGAVDLFQEPLCGLERMEDALMMDGLGKDLGDDRAVVLAQVGDNDVRVIAFGAQGEQEGMGAEAGCVPRSRKGVWNRG